MSLLYTMFGVPRTVDEFSDKAKKKNEQKVVITVDQCESMGSVADVMPPLGYRATMRAGNVVFKMKKHTNSPFPIGYSESTGTSYHDIVIMEKSERNEQKQPAQEDAREAARKLRELGFIVRIQDGHKDLFS